MEWEEPVVVELSNDSEAAGLCVVGSGASGATCLAVGNIADGTCFTGNFVNPAVCSNGFGD